MLALADSAGHVDLRRLMGELAARGVNVVNTPIAERSAYREIFDCGGTLYSMDAAKISNLDKAQDNAKAFASEVLGLLPVKIIRSAQPRRLFRLVRSAA